MSLTTIPQVDTSQHENSNGLNDSESLASPTHNTFKNLEKHPMYYLPCADLHLLVGGCCLFRVHSHFFERDATVFKELLAIQPDGFRLGSADWSALVLDTTREDFEKFLYVFYNPKFTLYDFSVEDWTAILDQAHRWRFDNVKNLAIRELERLPMPDVHRVALYEKYDVDKLALVPIYIRLATRAMPLDIEESRKLGLGTTVEIFRGREQVQVLSKQSQPSPMELNNLACSMLKIASAASECSTKDSKNEKDSAKLVVSSKEGRQGGTPERSTPKPEKKKRV